MAESLLKSKFKTTAEISVPKNLVGQVIGQEKSVEVANKAAGQKRNMLLIGEPGTGKSMIAQAMSELLPVRKLEDVLVYPNLSDKNNPKIRVMSAGDGRKLVTNEKKRVIQASISEMKPNFGIIFFISIIFALAIGVAIWLKLFSDVILAAFIIVGGIFMAILIFASAFAAGLKNFRPNGKGDNLSPKLLVDNADKKTAPFVDATGARAGALLGDVRHDPYQSGGLGTPAQFRVEAGMIHKANGGVLFIDEVSTLSPKAQQELLTAMQEKKYSITGQSEMSSGAMVHTTPAPCDFVLVASGNMVDLQKMHPALRSRIRGYGYEVYLNDDIEDNLKNREFLAQFVAQEIKKDGKIPHFSRDAVEEIILEARRRAGRKKRLTLRLRDLGGLIRAAGDVARSKNKNLVTRQEIIEAREVAKTLEQQFADKAIAVKKGYRVFDTKGFAVGKVNGLAVMGRGHEGGILLPIEAEVTPTQSMSEGKTIATGKLGDIAKEAVQNVFAIIKRYKGKGIKNYDIHIQFLQTYEGVEGDSASISVATAVVSALERIPVDQSVAMTGSLSIKGEVLPVGGITPKVEAAIETGAKTVLVPESNKEDVFLDPKNLKKINIVPVKDIADVLQYALKTSPNKKKLLTNVRKLIRN